MNRTVWLQLGSMAVAVGLFGLSFGAMADAAGLSPLAACGMSALVFAGGAQFAALSVLVAGGGWLAAAASGLLLNARYLGFGLAIADRMSGSWFRRALAAHLLIDESALLAMATPDALDAEAVYWWSGGMLFVAWNLGTFGGIWLGDAVGDPSTLGLDAAVSAGMVAVLLPSLTSRRRRLAALLGAALAIVAIPLTPAGAPVVLAALGALIADVAVPGVPA